MTAYNHVLWYDKPAQYWAEALPLGNGRMGAMVFGGVQQERIQLNHDTLWAGHPFTDAEYPQSIRKDLPEIRRLIRERRFSEASELTTKAVGDNHAEAYELAGDLWLDFDAPSTAETYHRQLDLQKALFTARMTAGSNTCTREAFISAPAQVMVVRLRAEGSKNALNFTMRVSSLMRGHADTYEQTLRFTGRCPYHNNSVHGVDRIIWEKDGKTGVGFQVHTRPVIVGSVGKITVEKDTLRVSDAQEVLLYIAIATDFVAFDRWPDTTRDLTQECIQRLDAAAKQGWEKLLAEHTKDHQRLYSRCTLELKNSSSDKKEERPTNERIKNYMRNQNDPALCALLFHYGRYLLITSSRPGTQAANLQGIWNDLLCPPWACEYTTNINLEMNYWHAETCHLAECTEPLFTLIKELSQTGKRLARDMYNANGWCTHHNADLWRFGVPAGAHARWGYWTVCNAWLCQHLWEHYLFNGDQKFLKETAWPLMKGAAEFFLDFLIEDQDGYLTTSPASSPENEFTDPATGKGSAVCASSAMDLSLIRQLFNNCIAAAGAMNAENTFAEKLAKTVARLRPLAIGPHGQLLEYGEDFPEPEPTHRHISHLYGLYPGDLFTPHQQREFYDACKVSIERRGDKSTGWAMAWRVAIWARLLDGDHALHVIGELLHLVDPNPKTNYHEGGIYPNLFDAHPPFQIDGNFGVTAAIAEMFLQSHELENGKPLLRLLPALPSSWPDGRIQGLRARGGLELDIQWSNGKFTQVLLKATRDTAVVVDTGVKKISLDIPAGATHTLK